MEKIKGISVHKTHWFKKKINQMQGEFCFCFFLFFFWFKITGIFSKLLDLELQSSNTGNIKIPAKEISHLSEELCS